MDDIDQRAWRDTYARDWRLRAQQTKSRLVALCDNNPESTDQRYFYFDTMGNTDPEPKQSYAQDTPDISVGSERRRGSWQVFHWGKTYDEDQTAKLIGNPQPKHQTNAINGFHRKQDDVVIAAALNPVIVMDTSDAGISTPLPAAQIKTEGGTNGLTIAKLHVLREGFDDAEVDETEFGANGQIVGDPHRTLIVNSRQITNLLDDPKIGSADYNTVKALQNGTIEGFMGFRFIRSTRLPKSGSMRRIIALAKGAIGIPPVQEPSVKLAELPGKSFATQLYLRARYGGIRVEDARVMTYECYEA